ncbi:uncharacterized protein LOC144667429 isoform X2 [Oculina patagonica]
MDNDHFLWCSLDAVYAGNYAYCVTPCTSSPCKNGGTCTASGNSFSCQCKNNFTGATCDQAVQQGRPWHKLNTSPVCFGIDNSQYGTFKIPAGGNLELIKLKLVHLDGYVSCYRYTVTYWSHWGCGLRFGSTPEYVLVAITNTHNKILLPPSQLQKSQSTADLFFVPGYTSQSPELVLSAFYPLAVQTGQELRLWYTEDLLQTSPKDDGGRVCCDVYAQFL